MILILDDHPLAREGLASILQMHRPEEPIVQAGCVREAIAQMTAASADMVFVDVNLGGESGFSFVQWLRDRGLQAKVFCITSSSRARDFRYAKEMGVDAYVLKEAFIDDIVYGLTVVERGGKFYSSALAERMDRATEEERLLENLTARELDVLVLLSQAYSNSKISDTLYISEATTKKHITSLLGKLGLESRMEAMLFGVNNQYITRQAVRRAVKQDKRKGDFTCDATGRNAAARSSH